MDAKQIPLKIIRLWINDEKAKSLDELTKRMPQEVIDVAMTSFGINDGTCAECGSYNLRRSGVYVHTYECPNTERKDHNLSGKRPEVPFK